MGILVGESFPFSVDCKRGPQAGSGDGSQDVRRNERFLLDLRCCNRSQKSARDPLFSHHLCWFTLSGTVVSLGHLLPADPAVDRRLHFYPSFHKQLAAGLPFFVLQNFPSIRHTTLQPAVVGPPFSETAGRGEQQQKE